MAGRDPRKRITDKEIERIRGFNAYPLLPWVLLVLSPAHAIVDGSYPRPVVALSGLAVFTVLYCSTVLCTFHRRTRTTRVPMVLALVLVPVTGALAGSLPQGLLLYPLLAIACAVVAPNRGGPLVLFGVAALASLTSYMRGQSGDDVFGVAWSSLLPGVVVFVLLKLFSVVNQLKETREELARAAVAEERLRFSRDLHDLLGHTMSVIALKAEMIRRVAPRDLDAAVTNAADIELVSRKALAEIREAVSGYREAGLTEELQRACELLSAGGIEPVLKESGPPLPARAEGLLAWVVREGVTNVVRHSRALHCEIELDRGTDPVRLSIRDDGSGLPADESSQPGRIPASRRPGDGGNGLRGLAERVAAAGGTLTAQPSSSGFQLLATLPAQR